MSDLWFCGCCQNGQIGIIWVFFFLNIPLLCTWAFWLSSIVCVITTQSSKNKHGEQQNNAEQQLRQGSLKFVRIF